ncbi:MAG TPA: peptide chain release factor N(5)-glutamine methyltransferase [Pyrinomonadaceae bacterium]|nr:peptide chain release factor N(5)-glutamine methyltransferase [Pyrinomonadaceae bacterium]
MTFFIADAIREGAETLQQAGLADPRREASGLLQHVVRLDRTFILAHPEHSISDEQMQSFRELVVRRASGEPLQYITTHQSFYGLDFEVGKGVLIPRPETELLVESALELLQGPHAAASICDVGTGSGCIAITLLHERPEATAVAIDISTAALEIAKRNAKHHSVDNRLTFGQGNCFSSLSPEDFAFDLIVSNPPYVAEPDLAGLQREVRDHEPLEALSGGVDGLDVVRHLLSESGAFLKQGGHLLIEIGFNQAAAVEALIDSHAWLSRGIRADLQGIPRVVVVQKSST